MRHYWRALVLGGAGVAAAIILGLTLTGGGPGAREGGAALVTIPEPAADTAGPDGQGKRKLDLFTTAAQGFSYGEPGFAATRDKTQSKLWFHDGSWWATMIDPYTEEVHVFEYRDGVWTDTRVFVDSRARSSADVVWTGSRLYIASRTSTGELLLQQYTYGQDRSWVPVSGAPELITRGGGQSLTIAVDTQGRVWATWISGGQVHITSSDPDGRNFRPPGTPPGGTNVQDEDATAITALAGKIGVLWSDQSLGAFLWTARDDAAPVTDWTENVTVTQGVNFADGHIDFAVTPDGNLYAAVKTSLGDDGEPLDSPLIEVLHRNVAGQWAKVTAATVGNQMTRAQLVVTSDGKHLILIATSPQSGGSLYYKTSETENPQFAPGKGSLLLGWDGALLNDATTTHAPVDPAVPLMVLASDADQGRYYYAELSIGDLLSVRQ